MTPLMRTMEVVKNVYKDGPTQQKIMQFAQSFSDVHSQMLTCLISASVENPKETQERMRQCAFPADMQKEVQKFTEYFNQNDYLAFLRFLFTEGSRALRKVGAAWLLQLAPSKIPKLKTEIYQLIAYALTELDVKNQNQEISATDVRTEIEKEFQQKIENGIQRFIHSLLSNPDGNKK